MKSSSQRGSAIIMLFVAVALFGMISYAFLQGSRGGTSMIKGEQDKAAATQSQDCTNSVNMAVQRLRMRGCGDIISYAEDGSNSAPGAPTDGTCSIYHPAGGGVKNCGDSRVVNCSDAQLTALAIGAICGDMVYAGISPDGSTRMYTTLADAPSTSWNFGNNSFKVAVGVTSPITGESNTAAIVASDSDSGTPGMQENKAATYCSNLVVDGRTDWYLPASNEMQVLYTNRNAIGGFGTGNYIVSSENPVNAANATFRLEFGGGGLGDYGKEDITPMRCTRKD